MAVAGSTIERKIPRDQHKIPPRSILPFANTLALTLAPWFRPILTQRRWSIQPDHLLTAVFLQREHSGPFQRSTFLSCLLVLFGGSKMFVAAGWSGVWNLSF